MMRNVSLCCLLLALSVNVFAQSTNCDWDNMIGFACGAKGRATVSIMHIGGLVRQKKFDSIRVLMHSPIPAIKYLSIRTSEILERKGMIHFSADEKTAINEIKKSMETFCYCSGCTERQLYTLMELFADNSITLNKEIINWVKSQLKVKQK